MTYTYNNCLMCNKPCSHKYCSQSCTDRFKKIKMRLKRNGGTYLTNWIKMFLEDGAGGYATPVKSKEYQTILYYATEIGALTREYEVPQSPSGTIYIITFDLERMREFLDNVTKV